MRLQLDFDACTGHGRCYALAPELFEADDEGYGKLVISSGDVPLDLEETARKAVNNCPERAISLEDRPADRSERTDRTTEGARRWS